MTIIPESTRSDDNVGEFDAGAAPVSRQAAISTHCSECGTKLPETDLEHGLEVCFFCDFVTVPKTETKEDAMERPGESLGSSDRTSSNALGARAGEALYLSGRLSEAEAEVKRLKYANEQFAYLWDVEAEREKLEVEVERLRSVLGSVGLKALELLEKELGTGARR